MKIRTGAIPRYGLISKSQVVRECFKIVFNYFKREDDKKIEMLKELKRLVLRDKIKLLELSNKLKE